MLQMHIYFVLWPIFFVKVTTQTKTKPMNRMKRSYLWNIVRIHFLRLSGYLNPFIRVKQLTVESTKPQTAINMVQQLKAAIIKPQDAYLHESVSVMCFGTGEFLFC
jgi:hypothetical protein